MFDLADIHEVHRYQDLDRKSAHIISTSSTHGLIVSKDRLNPHRGRIFLVGCSGGSYTPHIKAHNSFTASDLLQVMMAVAHTKKLIELRA